MPHNKQLEVFAECQHWGEAEVRNMLVQGRWNEEKQPHVRLWLERLEMERDEAANAEHIRLARSADAAAWEAARAAKRANIIAIVALIASAVAIAFPVLRTH